MKIKKKIPYSLRKYLRRQKAVIWKTESNPAVREKLTDELYKRINYGGRK